MEHGDLGIRVDLLVAPAIIGGTYEVTTVLAWKSWRDLHFARIERHDDHLPQEPIRIRFLVPSRVFQSARFREETIP